MTDLTDTQLVLLSAAAQRDDHVIPIADRLKGAIAKTVVEKMIALGLAEERLVDLRTPAWRRDEDGHSIALLISANGLAALGLGDDGPAVGPAIAGKYAPHRGEGDAEPSNETTPTLARKTIHGATKRAAVIDLLQRVGGHRSMKSCW